MIFPCSHQFASLIRKSWLAASSLFLLSGFAISLQAENLLEFDTGRNRPSVNGLPVLGSGLAMSGGSFRGVPVGELPKWTLSLWFQAESTDSGDLFGVVTNRNRGEGFQLSFGGGNLVLRKVGGDPKRHWDLKQPGVSSGQWHQVVITCTHGIGPVLYLDGKKSKQGSPGGMGYALLFDDYFLGAGNWGEKKAGVNLDGLIDDFSLHSRAFSEEEVAELFQGKTFPGSLVAFNDFENVNHRDLAVFTQSDRDEAYLDQGKALYELHCVTCHSKDGVTPPLNPLSRFFSKHPMENGGDPFSMFKTITYGFRNMMPATQVEPADRYKVIHYIRERLIKENAPELYVKVDPRYADAMPLNPKASQEQALRMDQLAKSGYLRDYGGALCSPVQRGKPGALASPNALTIDLGSETTLSYDLGTMRSIGAWTGGFLDISNSLHHKLRAPGLPTARFEDLAGTEQWRWAWGGRAEIPVPDLTPHTKWPDEQMRFRGHYPHGDEITISYEVQRRGVLESPLAESIDGINFLHHRMTVASGENALEIIVLSGEGSRLSISGREAEMERGKRVHRAWVQGGDAATWRVSEKSGDLILTIAPSEEAMHLNVVVADLASTQKNAALPSTRVEDLSERIEGGPSRWATQHTMKGKLAVSRFQGYAMDSLPVPLKNEYNSWMRTASLAFFDDGRLAVATLAGDVWIVSGINGTLENVTWKRFAAGLYEPLGMKVVDGVLTAITRGRIVKLHDLNDDGEADFYEAFFNEDEPDKGWHAYSFDLEVGNDGSFYYARTGGFSEWSVPGGIVRVASDGASSEVVGVGLRTPNGIGKLGDGRITFGDNQGTYVPASKISISQAGDFHGAGKWEKREGSFDPEAIVPPIVYMPQELDSSSGSQLWVEQDDRFGPLSDRLYHTSFGRATTMYVMLDEVEEVTQGAVFSLPMQMESGTMRAAKNPVDGQLYYSGLTGWQAGGSREGSIQRLRFTEEDGLYLIDAKARKDRIELSFNHPLDPSKLDPTSWKAEAWNYRWSKGYGSPNFKVTEPGVEGTDEWGITGFNLDDDGRRLILKVPDLQPCDTLKLEFGVHGRTDLSLEGPVFFTIHQLPE